MQNQNMSLLFSTADPDNVFSHKIIVGAVLRCEGNIKGVELTLFNMVKKVRWFSYLRLLFVFMTSLLTNSFLGVSATKITYRKVSIGRYAVAEALRHPSAYLDKKTYYSRLIKSIWNCILNVDNFLKMKDDIAACYINDPGYSNGVFCELATLHGIPFYHNTYPYRLTRFVPKNGSVTIDAFIVHPCNTAENRRELGKQVLESIISSTEQIVYMANVDFQSRHLSVSDADAVIYAHSFTDSQQIYGGDSQFLNMYEWLSFTLEKLGSKKVILKAHPGFFNKNYSAEVIEWDRLIFAEISKLLANKENVTVIDWPMRNSELLGGLKKDCVLVSHHGNALIEGAGMGFKCISSEATPWAKYELFNTWRTKREYITLLEDYALLEHTKLDMLHEYVHDVYRGECSFFSDLTWRQIVENETGILATEISRDRSVLEALSAEDMQRVIEVIASTIGTVRMSADKLC